ncbi:MAG: hypothetical protein QNJ15_14125 [Erythrobacter sp.]|nr:hypothetical protein [Erythrobacter sp.]
MLRTPPRRLTLIALAAGLATIAPLAVVAQDELRAAPPPVSDDFSDLEETQPETTETAPEMQAALDAMDEVIGALDGDAERTGNNWQFTIDERMMLAVTDTNAGRMRVITPIAPVDALPEEALMRLMQANFDTALDARYAVGQGLVWGAFIHPLDSLTTRDFASGVLQTHTLAETFGTTFSSGALNYGGGDSGAIIEEQLKELLEELEKRATT